MSCVDYQSRRFDRVRPDWRVGTRRVNQYWLGGCREAILVFLGSMSSLELSQSGVALMFPFEIFGTDLIALRVYQC